MGVIYVGVMSITLGANSEIGRSSSPCFSNANPNHNINKTSSSYGYTNTSACVSDSDAAHLTGRVSMTQLYKEAHMIQKCEKQCTQKYHRYSNKHWDNMQLQAKLGLQVDLL